MLESSELIEKFIDEHLPKIADADNIPDEFEKFWQEEKVLALGKICEEENLEIWNLSKNGMGKRLELLGVKEGS
ncbi:hypothetical protein JWH17_06370 [Desulfobulbus marinus]|nr:hypothetical protein [Desulfogranum marinum]